MWQMIAGLASSLLGGLFGGKGPKIDQTNLNEAFAKLNEQYKGANNPYYEGVMRNLLEYFQGGGSASEQNRNKALGQVERTVGNAIPDYQTRMQNMQAKAGIFLPGTVASKGIADVATKAAFERSRGYQEVNERFDTRLDQNKGLAMSTAGNYASMLKNLAVQIASQQGNLAINKGQQDMQRSSMGTNWGQMLQGFGGSLLGGAFGGGDWDIGNQWASSPGGGGGGGNLLGWHGGRAPDIFSSMPSMMGYRSLYGNF